MSSADLLQCMPPNGSESIVKSQPSETNSTGLPSSPSVSVSSSESPSQTSPTLACDSSGRAQPENEENVTIIDEQSIGTADSRLENAVESQESTSSTTSASASPVKIDNVPHGEQVSPHLYNLSSQFGQRLPVNASRPRRLQLPRARVGGAPFANRVAVVTSTQQSQARPVNGDITPNFMPQNRIDFPPSSNSSSPITGYGLNPMQPYPIMSNMLYQTAQPVQLVVGNEQPNGDVVQAENGNAACENGVVNSNNESDVGEVTSDAALAAASSHHLMHFHVNPGVVFNVNVDGEVRPVTGPTNVPMVSPNGPPHALPIQVPPTHVVHQVIDEHGALRHVFLSLQGPPPHGVFPATTTESGEYIGAIPPTSSPSQNGTNMATTSSGSGGSRTNTPPSPPQQQQAQNAASTFQPAPPPFTMYHPLAPPPHFMIPHHPMSIPPGHPYPVSPVSIPPQVGIPNIEAGVYHPTTTGTTAPGSTFYVSRSTRSGSQTKEDGSHDSGAEEQVAHVYTADINQQSPVILVNGEGGQIIVSNNYDIPSNGGGYTQPAQIDQYSTIPRKNTTFNSANVMSGRVSNRPWRKRDANTSSSNLPARLRNSKNDSEGASHTDGGGDDTSSSGSGRTPSSPPRQRGNSVDSSAAVNGGKKCSLNKKERSYNHHSKKETGQSNPNNGKMSANGSEQPEVTDEEVTEEEIQRSRVIEEIITALSQLGPPKLVNVSATSLTVEMSPLPIDEVVKATGLTDESTVKPLIVYDVSLSVPQRESQMDNIYTGQAAEVNVVDLKPATHYSLGVAAVYSGPPTTSSVRGAQLPLLNFQTGPAAPEKPDPPKLARRNAVKANSMELRWSPAVDNGSALMSYILEWKQGPTVDDPTSVGQTNFTEVFRCDAAERQYKLTNLKPATLYSFRMAATNKLGQSPYSDEVTYRTSGAPPPAPEPPLLQSADVSSLSLYWSANVGGAVSSAPLEFTLQMEDPISGYGFIPVYRGSEATEFTVRNLRRNADYRFRLSAENDDGPSKWSDPIVCYKTIPDAPKPPARVQVKSAGSKATALSSNSIRLVWDAPRDDGGVPIDSYEVQVVETKTEEEVQPIFMTTTGPEREIFVGDLKPGRAYNCKVRAKGIGGVGSWSDAAIAGTAAITPDACSSPAQLKGRAKPTLMEVEWLPPQSDGGSAVVNYEVQLAEVLSLNLQSPSRLKANDLSEFHTVYLGQDLSCIVDKLSPGVGYFFQVRAANRIGFGPWSPALPAQSPVEFYTTAASRPDAPGAPKVSATSANIVAISWKPPRSNGSKVTEYRLEESSDSTTFSIAYSGTHLSYEAKSLKPATQYLFRLQAVNSAGVSPYSPVMSCVTPPAAPVAPGDVSSTPLSPSSISLFWLPPHDNGSAINSYNISIHPGDRVISVPIVPVSPIHNAIEEQEDGDEMDDINQEAEFTDESAALDDHHLEQVIDNLKPDTIYRVKVQAINEIGAGAFSVPLKVITPPLPPQPPEIELAEAGHNFIRIRWAAIPLAATAVPGVDLTEYTIFMDKPNSLRLQPVWTGTSLSFTARRLHERTKYRFAIQARTQSGGIGQQSANPRTFSTLPAPPTAPCNLTVSTPSTEHPSSVTASWKPVNTSHPDVKVEYILQCTQPGSSNSFAQVYRGLEPFFSFMSDQLVSGVYSVRVGATLVLSGDEFVTNAKAQTSAFSQAHQFRIHKISKDHVQLLSPSAEPVLKAEKALPTTATVVNSEQGSVKRSASIGALVIRMLEAVHLRRRSDEESWTDTQLAAGFVMAFTVLALVLSYVAHSFLSNSAS